jgi:hypothetical protein
LERTFPGVLSRDTETLARELEDRLRPRTAGMSVEVLRQLRDHSWFASLANAPLPNLAKVPLDQYLRQLANDYLEPRGRSVSLRYRPVSHLVDADRCDEAECAARWRWLSFFLPPDLLIGALYAGTRSDPPTDQVSLVTPHLASVLLHEVADTHLHLGAAFSFDRLWASLMRALAGNMLGLKRIRSAVSTPFGDGEHLCRLLLAAAIVRLLLAAFLWDRASGARPRSFVGFWNDQDGVPQIAEALRRPRGAGQGLAQLSSALAVLVAGDTRMPLATLHAVYQKLIGPKPRRRPGPVDLFGADPLADWLTSNNTQALPETRFVPLAIDYLGYSGDEDFALAFWQYQRVRCQTYQYLVEEPSTSGLDWFKRHYDRLQIFRSQLDSSAVLGALRLESLDIGLGAMEVRTAPSPRWQDARDKIRWVADQAARYKCTPAASRPEIGIILHFLKEERCDCGRALADPRHKAFGSRYAPWFMRSQQQAQAIETLLRHHPEFLLLLRGVDVASVELAIPTWVLVPLFRRIDRTAIDAAARLAHQEPTWQVSALRHTVHAGEDYRRLAEGLRHIHEAVEFGLLRPGDRIGHGFALGVDPERWAAAARTIAQPREERLDDLLWELQRYGSAEWAADSARLEFVRAEAVRLAQKIYQVQFINPDKLIEARNLRHNADFLNHLGYPFMRARRPRRGSPEYLAWLHLVDGDVFERGQLPELVHADPSEVAALQAAQRWLSHLLGRLEITIESNPSSNLLIGDLLQIEDHPLFRLQPLPGQPCPNGSAVLVSINDDDPMTFATRVADEFAHLYFALLRRGTPAQDALRFIGTLRENGWRSRFTLPASADIDILEGLAAVRGKPLTGSRLGGITAAN